ncbi:MAG: DUF4292 domain-containing protein [Cyclobacteriaceae bacterium]|nr:MAG: DUF4292 domain-containing protein [Cyclobacteriaceae bacterium]
MLQGCHRKAVPALSLPDAPKTIDIEEIDFGYMHGKARMVLRDEKREREVKANIRIRKDSVIWMTFSVVGVQGERHSSTKIPLPLLAIWIKNTTFLITRNYQPGSILKLTTKY